MTLVNYVSRLEALGNVLFSSERAVVTLTIVVTQPEIDVTSRRARLFHYFDWHNEINPIIW